MIKKWLLDYQMAIIYRLSNGVLSFLLNDVCHWYVVWYVDVYTIILAESGGHLNS